MHGKNRIRDNQLSPVWLACLQHVLQSRHVFMAGCRREMVRINVYCGARKPAAVDDTGVVQLIAVDRVALPDQGRDRTDVGGVPGRKKQGSFGTLELSQLFPTGYAANVGAI